MTGLLHRLAARAAGTGWTMRSDVRLLFGGAGLEQVEDAAAPRMETAVPERRAPAQARPGSAGSAAAMPRQATPPRAQAPVAAAEPAQPTGFAHPAYPAQPATAAAMPKPLMPMAPQPPAPRMPLAATPRTRPPGAPAAPAQAADIPAIASPQAQVQAQTLARPQSPPLYRHDDPAPLLPPQPQIAGHAAPLAQSARGPAAFTVRPAPQAAADRETEVHIHIGRIDVTALHEAPRPKARPRERTQPLSLDAYLAARSKPS